MNAIRKDRKITVTVTIFSYFCCCKKIKREVMRIILNSRIAKLLSFLSRDGVIMLFGQIFTDRCFISEKEIWHKSIHVTQYHDQFALGTFIAAVASITTMFVYGPTAWCCLFMLIPLFMYYVWYFVEYVIRLTNLLFKNKFANIGLCALKAHQSMAFEREALDLENEYLINEENRVYPCTLGFMEYYME